MMFNGIIKETGKIYNISKNKNDCYLQVLSRVRISKSEIGSSISCSGVCLTLEKVKKNICTFYLSKETLKRTNFNILKKGSVVNLEKSLKYGDRISGHFIQGHIDTTCRIDKINIVGKTWLINFLISRELKKNTIEKGSIAINGISLTISKIFKNGFQISVIPKTLKLTNLIYLKEKDLVNVEFDVLGKYIKSSLK